MKVLVIGGCGFIGSHVVDCLVEAGHRVRVFDRQPERFRPPVSGVDYRLGNISDRMEVIDAVSGVDAVMHLASSTFPGTGDLDPRTDVIDNLVNSLGLLDVMVSVGVRRLLFMSSGGTVYGYPTVLPIPESHPLQPINSYGIVKTAIEHYVQLYSRTRGISAVVMRPSNPFGPRQGHIGVQGVIMTFLRRLAADEPVEVWGDGSVVRDYLYIRDLALLCVQALASGKEGTYNAGSGHGHSINEIIDTVAQVIGQPVDVHYKPGRHVDVPRSVLDIRQATETFGWAPRTSLADGIGLTWDWLQDQ